MAGARQPITIDVDDTEVQSALSNAIEQVGDLKPAMTAIGEALLLSVDERFINQKDPDDRAWEKLSALTVSLRGSATPVLQDDGYLRGSIRYNASSDSVEVGTNKIYGAMMQLGGTTSPDAMIPNKKIPERPFLGVSKSDREEILEIMGDFVKTSLKA